MTTRTDVEHLLRQIPLSTPGDESHAGDILQTFVGLRNAAFDGIELEGRSLSIPGTTTALSIPALIDQLRARNYVDVALTLIGVAGDAASAFAFLVDAGITLEAVGVTGGLASAGIVASAIGEAAGPAGLAAAVLVGTLRIPSDVNENNKKLFFITDASGILASWIFNLPHINPHGRLTASARRGGYFSADVSEGCRLAHDRVQDLWMHSYRGNASAVKAAQTAAGNSWERCWRQHGAALEQRLVPLPHGMGAGWVDAQILVARRRALAAAHRPLSAAALRRAAGGNWFRTPEGVELFIPVD